MSLIAVENLAFSYGGEPVFSGVSFSVDAGQVFCLVGPNGCGKTTLVHCILSHVKPTQGSVAVAGKDAAAVSPRELAAAVAYVPQSHTRFFPYKAVDVVAMGRTRMRKLLEGADGQREAAYAVMDEMGIGHLAEADYTTLSGGELQMVLIARALAQESSVLVLDEPVAHLDVKRTQHVLGLLGRLAVEKGKAVVMTTHDFGHPLHLQDEGVDVRMALMNEGALGVQGDPLGLLSSGCVDEAYGVHSRVIAVEADITRHYLATWSGGD